jgi:hypothetical protein
LGQQRRETPLDALMLFQVMKHGAILKTDRERLTAGGL